LSLIGAQNFAYLQQFGMTAPWAGNGNPSPKSKPRRSPKKAATPQDPETLEYIVFADHVAQ